MRIARGSLFLQGGARAKIYGAGKAKNFTAGSWQNKTQCQLCKSVGGPIITLVWSVY